VSCAIQLIPILQEQLSCSPHDAYSWLRRECAGRNASERQASLEKDDAQTVSGASGPLSRWLDILVGDGAVGSGSALQVIARSGPSPGEEVVEAGIWPDIDEMAENVGKVPIRIDAGELASLCHVTLWASRPEQAQVPRDNCVLLAAHVKT